MSIAEQIEGQRLLRRHQLKPGQCAYCDREREAGNTFFPWHDASAFCESGKHEHCTCDTCF
jgi:hypothetical protein